MEKYIAIDNVCAWPNLTMLPNGDIAAVIFNIPSHSSFEGEVECWLSKDGGYFWNKEGVPAPHRPNENRMNVSAGLSIDGALIVICSGWTPVPKFGEMDKVVAERNVLESVVCRSYDNGKTWIQDGYINKPEGIETIIPFGDIVQSSDGILGASFYAIDTSKEINKINPYIFTSYFVKSYDEGKTWSEWSFIGDKEKASKIDITNNETALICIDGQNVLAAARTTNNTSDQHIELYSSEDFGSTWLSKGPVTLAKQHPGHILMLQDGNLLMTYGIRNKPFCGIGARLSKDQGESWSAPIFLVNFENITDCGYPSSVQVNDGTIVTAYYCKNIPWHNRYHMGVVRWKTEEF